MNRDRRALELLVVDAPAQRRDPQERLAQHLGIMVRHADHDVADRRLLQRVDHTGRAEVDESEPAVGEDHHVPRVRVRVVAAVDQHLLEHRPEQRVRELSAIGTHRRDVRRVAHALAVEPLHHEHTRRRQLEVHTRYANARIREDVRRDLDRVASLDAVVELLAQALAELLGQVDDAVVGAPGGAGLDRVGELRRARRGRAAPTRRCRGAAPSR